MEQPIVLLVEDNPRDARAVQRAFTQAHLTPDLRIVENGEEALAYLQRQGPYADPSVSPYPHLILLDLYMPRMGGHEVLQYCKQDDRFKRIPIVMLTTSGRPDDVRLALQAGANAYLLKPVAVDRLMAVMGQVGLFAVDVRQVLERVLHDLQPEIADTSATVHMPEALPRVIYPEAHLAQIFSNLMSNALKFTAERPPEVTVGCDAEAQYYRFTVRDNGRGIAPKNAESIFDIFQRLGAGEAYPGTGAGLTVVKKIVESHGGQIGVDSTPGDGSTFWFTIPKAEESP